MLEENGGKVDYEEIIRPYTYLKTQTQGKGFRNRLLEVFNIYYGLSQQDLSVVQEFIDILHNSSLLVDDVEDDGTVRRGKTCAHRIFGIAHTINAGNLMYFKAWEKLLELGVPELSKIFVDSMIKLHVGQGTELCWRTAETYPSEEQYLQMVVGKTGELFGLGVRVMACLRASRRGDGGDDGARVTEQLQRYCDILGMLYQIKNDLENLEGSELDRENYAHDLKEGKYSLPVIYYLRTRRPATAGWRAEKDQTSYENRVELAREIRDCGGLQYSEDKIGELRRQGLELSDTVGNNLEPATALLRRGLLGVISVVADTNSKP